MAYISQRQTRSETSSNRYNSMVEMAGPSYATTSINTLPTDEAEQRLRSAWDLLSLCSGSPMPAPSPPLQPPFPSTQSLPGLVTRSRANLESQQSSAYSSPGPSSPELDAPPARSTRKRPRSDTTSQIVAPRRVVPAVDDDESSNATDSSSGGGVSVARRFRKSIVLPTPVDGLTKSSRGRKMPSVPSLDSKTEEIAPEGALLVSTTGKGRTYVCTVKDCHKIFIRGEHLKRHVRSIHTHEKPHPCPHPNCGKSFSRRDNLGQHLLIHSRGGNIH